MEGGGGKKGFVCARVCVICCKLHYVGMNAASAQATSVRMPARAHEVHFK